MTMQLSDFAKGQTVRYVGPQGTASRHPERIGRLATVKQVVKSRKVVTIEWHDGSIGHGGWFDAYPTSLELIQS